jgi:hypothetical protein
MELNIEISGYQQGDLEIALQEVLDKVEQGYKSGFNSNDTGNFKFDIEGQEVEKWIISPMKITIGASVEPIEHYLVEDRYTNLDEAQDMLKDEALVGSTIYGISDNGIVLVEVV